MIHLRVDQIIESFLTFSDEYLLENYGRGNENIRWCMLPLRLEPFNKRTCITLPKKDEYKDIVDLKYRMRVTDTLNNFMHFN